MKYALDLRFSMIAFVIPSSVNWKWRDGSSNVQLWPYSTGINRLWGSYYSPAPSAPTIAIVDSGVDKNVPDLKDRVIHEENFIKGSTNHDHDRARRLIYACRTLFRRILFDSRDDRAGPARR